MAVHLEPPRAEALLTISGVRLGIARAGIRKPNRKDLAVIALDEGTRVAGVFTRNRFCAAPVLVCREHLEEEGPIRAIVVNTGVANAGTGAAGLENARAVCAAGGALLGIPASAVLPLSTGVMVLYADEESFTFMTPQGHVFAGWITFSAYAGCVSAIARQRQPVEVGYSCPFVTHMMRWWLAPGQMVWLPPSRWPAPDVR